VAKVRKRLAVSEVQSQIEGEEQYRVEISGGFVA
jgi:hypothetical protein